MAESFFGGVFIKVYDYSNVELLRPGGNCVKSLYLCSNFSFVKVSFVYLSCFVCSYITVYGKN